MTKHFKIAVVFLLIIGVLTVLAVDVFLYINPPIVPQNDQWKDPKLFGREITRPKNQPEARVLENFDDIRAIARKNTSYRDEEKWIAGNTVMGISSPGGFKTIRFFTQGYGLAGSTPTDIINHKNQIWVGFQGGVSKYIDNADEFKIYLEGESNVKLFEDPYEKKLYASTFQNFFYYDDVKDQWVNVAGSAPINSDRLVFTEKNIFGSSYPTALPVVIFDKERNIWEKSNIPEFGNQQGLTLFKAGSRVFIYGRNKDYSSCEDSGKQSASIFFEFKNGKWEPVEELNKKFYNNEPGIVGDKISQTGKASFAYEDPQCGELTKRIYKKAEFDFSNDKVVLIKEEIRETSFFEDGKNFQETVQEISDLLQVPPYRRIKGIDDYGNLYIQAINKKTINGNTGVSSSFLHFEPRDGYNSTTRTLINPDQLKDYASEPIIPIFCRTKGKTLSTYALIQSVDEMGGEATKAKLFKIRDNQAVEVNQIKEEILNTIGGYGNYGSGLICQNETFYWINGGADEGKIQTLDMNDFQLNQITIHGQQKIVPLYDISFSDQIRLWFTDEKKISLFYFDATDSRTKEVKTDFSKRTLAPGKGLTMIFAHKDRIWFYETEGAGKPKGQITITDLAGNKVKSFKARGYNFNVIALSNDYFVGSNSEGVFTFNYDQDGFNYIDQEKLPFWGTPTNFMPSKIVFKLFNYDDKIWFDGAEAGAFFLDYKDLGIPTN